MLYQIRVSTFEKKRYPVVVHTFTGETQAEALGYLNSHLKTDSFFRDCLLRQRFRDFACSNRIEQGWAKE